MIDKLKKEFALNIPFQDKFDDRNNSLNFIRLFLAILVIFAHSYPLGGFGKELFLRVNNNQKTFGELAVICFFIISGFLIAKSYLRINSFFRYLWHRFLRIVPGFWINLLITALIIAPILFFLEHKTLHGFLEGTSNSITYITNNLGFKITQYGIDGVLTSVPYGGVLNGSLWTLFYEVIGYLAVACLGFLGLLQKKYLNLAIFMALYVLTILDYLIPAAPARLLTFLIDIQIVNLLLYFFAGVVFLQFMDKIMFNYKLFIFCIFILIVAMFQNGFLLLGPIVLPYIVFFFSIVLPFRFINKFGDYSYGMYIYAFPVQQIFSFFNLNEPGLKIYFLLTTIYTFGFAFLSYHLVEKQFLKLKNIQIPSFIKRPSNLIKTNYLFSKYL